jgi:branched-chain amino acid transport system substrate-binding protein
MRRLLFLLVVSALLMAACAPAAAPAPAAPAAATQPAAPAASGEPAACKAEWGCAKIAAGQTVKIGMSGPLTGDYAAYGQDLADAMKLAIKDAGDVQGWKFELAAGDDGGGSEGGAAVANKFVSDPTFVAMAGHAFSGSTAAAIPIYEKAGVPLLSPSATNPDLTAKGSKVFNRNAFTDNDQASFAADFLAKNLGVKKLAIIHDGSDYGQGLAKTVQDKFVKDGGQVVSFSAITSGETDYTAPLSAVAASKPDGLYFGGYNADASVIANQKKQAGLDKIPFMGGDGMYGKDFLTKAGANGEGTYVTTLVPSGSPAKDAFDKAFKQAYGVDAGVRSGYTWNSYDAAAALIQAAKSVAVVSGDALYIPRAELVKAVRGLKDYKGIASVITCQQNGECNASGPVLYVVKDGAWSPVQK